MCDFPGTNADTWAKSLGLVTEHVSSSESLGYVTVEECSTAMFSSFGTNVPHTRHRSLSGSRNAWHTSAPEDKAIGLERVRMAGWILRRHPLPVDHGAASKSSHESMRVGLYFLSPPFIPSLHPSSNVDASEQHLSESDQHSGCRHDRHSPTSPSENPEGWVHRK